MHVYAYMWCTHTQHIHVCIQFYLCGFRAASVAEEAAWDLGVSLPKVRTHVAPPDRGWQINRSGNALIDAYIDIHKHCITPSALDTLSFEPLFLLWFGYVDASCIYRQITIQTLYPHVFISIWPNLLSVNTPFRSRPPVSLLNVPKNGQKPLDWDVKFSCSYFLGGYMLHNHFWGYNNYWDVSNSLDS